MVPGSIPIEGIFFFTEMKYKNNNVADFVY